MVAKRAEAAAFSALKLHILLQKLKIPCEKAKKELKMELKAIKSVLNKKKVNLLAFSRSDPSF